MDEKRDTYQSGLGERHEPGIESITVTAKRLCPRFRAPSSRYSQLFSAKAAAVRCKSVSYPHSGALKLKVPLHQLHPHVDLWAELLLKTSKETPLMECLVG